MLSVNPVLAERDVFTVNEFCQRGGFSRATFYELVARGDGPRILRVGGRRFITQKALEDWRRKREQAGPVRGRGRSAS